MTTNSLSRRSAYLVLFILAVLVTACTGSLSSPSVTESPENEPASLTEEEVSAVVEQLKEMDRLTRFTQSAAALSKGNSEDTEPTPGDVGTAAPELQGITGWLQAEPFTLESLRGKVVLIDFWTYTCVNCIRTLPFLKQWYDAYSDKGLVIVGVHSPEFTFEKVRSNVEGAIERHGLKYAVVQDNEFETWRAFDNHFWPAKYLIDKDGIIRYRHFGEGAYTDTEQKIQDLLQEADVGLSEEVLLPSLDNTRLSVSRQTRELYTGHLRNLSGSGQQLPASGGVPLPFIGSAKYYSSALGSSQSYVDPGEHRDDLLYLHGLWTKGRESVVHARRTENLEDYIVLTFFGSSANVVTSFEGAQSYTVVVTLDGGPVPDGNRGADVDADHLGNTFVLVDGPRMYNLVQGLGAGAHELKLSSNSDRFSVYAFTFGSSSEGP